MVRDGGRGCGRSEWEGGEQVVRGIDGAFVKGWIREGKSGRRSLASQSEVIK